MKKGTITVQFLQETLRSLEFYISKKDSTLKAELDDFMGKLYEKYVPTQTREYIESMADRDECPPRQRRPRPVRLIRPASAGDTPGIGAER